jgi:hypothetical protein
MLEEDYVGDWNLKKLAYVGINAINYLHARKMLHSVSKEIDVDDPIETVLNADRVAAAIQYNMMDAARLKSKDDDIDEDDIDYLLATL